MRKHQRAWTDHEIEQSVGNLLRVGVLLSTGVVLLGGIRYLIHYGGSTPSYQVFHGEPSDLRTFSGILADATSGRRRGLIQLGLLLLVATPIARVIFAAVAFAQQRDYVYLGITLVVLGVLLYSLVGLL